MAITILLNLQFVFFCVEPHFFSVLSHIFFCVKPHVAKGSIQLAALSRTTTTLSTTISTFQYCSKSVSWTNNVAHSLLVLRLDAAQQVVAAAQAAHEKDVRGWPAVTTEHLLHGSEHLPTMGFR
jgi:hypothetical protein